MQERPDAGHTGEVGGRDDDRALRRLDPDDAAASHRAADEDHRALAGGGVRGEPSVADEESAVFASWQRPADPAHAADRPLERAPGHHRHELALVLGRRMDVAERLERSPRGIRGGAEGGIAGRRPDQHGLGGGGAHRTLDDAAERHPRFANDAVSEPDRRHRRDDGEVAGTAAELDEAATPGIIEGGQPDLRDHLASRRSVVKIDLKKSVGGDRPGSARAPRHDLGIERHAERAPLGRGVGMSDAAAERAADPDRQMRDAVRDRRQETRQRPRRHRLLEDDVAGQGTDRDDAVALADAGKTGDAIDVDEHSRTREAEVHRRHQALPSGEHAAIAAMLGEERHGFIDRARREVVESRGLHAFSSLSPAAASFK